MVLCCSKIRLVNVLWITFDLLVKLVDLSLVHITLLLLFSLKVSNLLIFLLSHLLLIFSFGLELVVMVSVKLFDSKGMSLVNIF